MEITTEGQLKDAVGASWAVVAIEKRCKGSAIDGRPAVHDGSVGL